LIAYSNDLAHGFRYAGSYVARILGGAKPGDLPIEQTRASLLWWSIFKTELHPVPKTAKALGITVPPTLLSLADEVIE
jgi:ABC-type uncharacterized transport system substrate-binding protein